MEFLRYNGGELEKVMEKATSGGFESFHASLNNNTGEGRIVVKALIKSVLTTKTFSEFSPVSFGHWQECESEEEGKDTWFSV